MADVFVSYKAEDRARVTPLVDALSKAGFEVWWDAHIIAGGEWREQIETALESARCVVVVWSARSVAREGRFVRDEADRAQRRGVYLPVRVDRVEPPLGFGETQAYDLIDWKGDPGDPRLATLVAGVQAIMSQKHGFLRAPPGVQASKGVNRRLMLVGGATAAVALAGGGAWAWLKGSNTQARSVAVLPFANLSGDPTQGYFGDGLAEDLRTTLSRIGGLKVTARISSEAVRGLGAVAAAAKLGVDVILSGSVRNSSSAVRVTAQLINGNNGIESWSDSYDRGAGDVLSIQSEIAGSVATSLMRSLGIGNRNPREQVGTDNSTAHDLLLRADALQAHQEGEDIVRQVLAMAEAALALDPDYAAARAVHASALSNIAIFATNGNAERGRQLKQAEAEAREAIALDPRRSGNWSTLGFIQENLLDFRGALDSYRKAIARETSGLSNYAFFLAEMGKEKEAVSAASRGLEFDPLNPDAYSALGDAQYFARQYAGAIASLRKMLKVAPDRYYAHFYIALSLMWMGRLGDAAAELKAMPAGDRFRATAQAVISWRQNDRAASDRAVAMLAPNTMLRTFVAAQRGESHMALNYLEEALAERDPDISALPADPLLDPLRGEPRFKALLATLDFP